MTFPVENLQEYLLTSILHTLGNYNQYNMTYFVAHVTLYSLGSSSRNDDEQSKHFYGEQMYLYVAVA